MAQLSGQSEIIGVRLPIRVERLSGSVAALTTTDADGNWSVEVEPGEYVVVERWGATQTVQAAGEAKPDTGSTLYPPGSPGDSSRARARREAKA